VVFDYELKLGRALKHLQDLDREIRGWLGADHYSVRYEIDLNAKWDGPIPPGRYGVPDNSAAYFLAGSVFVPGQGPGTAPEGVEFGQGLVTAFASVDEQPPRDPIGVLIGDALHNMRSALDQLAYALASAFTKPLPEEIGRRSEFPIFGDEDTKGTPNMGSKLFNGGLGKIQGWNPAAQAVVEGLQPYKRGHDFRHDPLWALHELDRISKHRLLHTGVAGFAGTAWTIQEFRNVRCIGPGLIQSLAGTVETDTPISRIYGVHPIDPAANMHMEINPAIDIALGDETVYGGEPVLRSLATIHNHLVAVVVPALAPFL